MARDYEPRVILTLTPSGATEDGNGKAKATAEGSLPVLDFALL